MSLYYDLPAPKKPTEDQAAGPSASPATPSGSPSAPAGSASWLLQAGKLLPQRFPSAKPPPLPRALVASIKAKTATGSAGPPLVSAAPASSHAPSGYESVLTPVAVTSGPVLTPDELDTLDDPSILNKYDPARPNDYEQYCLEREQRRKEDELRVRMEKETADLMKKRARERESEPQYSSMSGLGFSQGNAAGASSAAGKLDLNVSGEEAFMRRQRLSGAPVGVSVPPPVPQQMGQQPQMKRQKIGQDAPSRIVLLKNMVGRGEVDGDLERETAGECEAKYGRVLRCLVHEVRPGLLQAVPDDEAVRIFVHFADVTSATKAYTSLGGRFFGGRAVRASYYPEDVFNRGDYTQ